MDNTWDVKNNYECIIYAKHYGIPATSMHFINSHISSLMFTE